MLSQAELLCIDEAAAIPLPVVKALLGPYLILMASTINGSAPLPLTPSHPYSTPHPPSLPPSLTPSLPHHLTLSLLPFLPSSLPPFLPPSLTPSLPHPFPSPPPSYEGTGRSLSLKFIDQLRQQSSADKAGISTATSRVLREVSLTEPIWYASGDAVEVWLNALLCLEATTVRPKFFWLTKTNTKTRTCSHYCTLVTKLTTNYSTSTFAN